MAAIHIILDPRERPIELRFNDDRMKVRLHHATISLDGLVFDGPQEIEEIAGHLIRMLLAAVAENDSAQLGDRIPVNFPPRPGDRTLITEKA